MSSASFPHSSPSSLKGWRTALAAVTQTAAAVAIALWLSNVPTTSAPRSELPAPQPDLLQAVDNFMSSPDQQLEVLRLQQERLREERAELAEQRSQLERREKDVAIEESFRDVDKIVPVRDGESFIADGDAENTVIVSCDETDIGFTAIQRSRGLILEARNLASCTPGTFNGGDEIGKAGKFDLGWTVFRPGD